MNQPNNQPEKSASENEVSTQSESDPIQEKSVAESDANDANPQKKDLESNESFDNSEINNTENDDADNADAEINNAENAHENKTGKTPVYVIIVGVILTLLVIVCLQVDDWGRDWTTNFAETTEEAKDINLRPVDSELPPSAFADKVVQQMLGANRWTVGKPQENDDGSVVIDLVHKTMILGFKDDVRVTIEPTEGGSRLNATSQSRVGKGDLGQNPRNLRELISRVRAGLVD